MFKVVDRFDRPQSQFLVVDFEPSIGNESK